MASLLATGVEGFALVDEADLNLGRALALVVSWRQAGGSGATFVEGDDAGPGEDFWKKETIDLCLADEDGVLPVADLAGVRAVPAALSPAMARRQVSRREMRG